MFCNTPRKEKHHTFLLDVVLMTGALVFVGPYRFPISSKAEVLCCGGVEAQFSGNALDDGCDCRRPAGPRARRSARAPAACTPRLLTRPVLMRNQKILTFVAPDDSAAPPYSRARSSAAGVRCSTDRRPQHRFAVLLRPCGAGFLHRCALPRLVRESTRRLVQTNGIGQCARTESC